jgi:hypothetical protein
MGRQPKEELARIKSVTKVSAKTLELMAKYGGHTNLKKIAQEVKKNKKS